MYVVEFFFSKFYIIHSFRYNKNMKGILLHLIFRNYAVNFFYIFNLTSIFLT